MALTINYRCWLDEVSTRVEKRLEEIIRLPAPAPLQAAMRDAVLGGGKRLRPAMVIAAADTNGTSGEILDIALEVGCALECLHCYSLVHDDLPCMDNADVRRGRAASHKIHGEAMALLAGDCLQTLAFALLTNSGLPVVAISLLAAAAGSNGMGGGQALDLQATNMDEVGLQRMHEMKTGALFHCALQLGLLCRRAQDVRLTNFAQPFGRLYQIVNDIKGASTDTAADKQTYVTVLGLATARQRAIMMHQEAQQVLDGSYPLLAAIADMVLESAEV